MRIDRTCEACDGTGQVEHGKDGTRTCYSCYGIGWHDGGKIVNGSKTLDERLTELEDKINDVMNKCNDIFEQVSG